MGKDTGNMLVFCERVCKLDDMTRHTHKDNQKHQSRSEEVEIRFGKSGLVGLKIHQFLD